MYASMFTATPRLPWAHMLCKLDKIVYLGVPSRGGTPQLFYYGIEYIPTLYTAGAHEISLFVTGKA